MRNSILMMGTVLLALPAPIKADVTANEKTPGSALERTDTKLDEGVDSKKMPDARERLEGGAEQASAPGQTNKSKKTSRDNRAASTLSLFYEPVNLGIVLPTKSGWAATWIFNEDWALEGEYLSGSYGIGISGIDLVDVSERLVLGKVRWTFGNSLNSSVGFGSRSYRFTLGSDTLAKITDYNVAALPSLRVENEFFSFGIGNRWQWNNGLTLGVDWLEVILTAGRGTIDDRVTGYLKDENDRKNAHEALNYLRYGPTFNALKIQLGYTF